jgi:hypothetical protein
LEKKLEGLKNWKKKRNQQYVKIKPFQSGGYGVNPLVTVWLNAWKYESTEQVWAGLADGIVREIASRLDPVEREWFFCN